ncbi:MAG: cupin domain-containing protein [Chloroflexaceae bacterium]|nr:cupin domain-containing protein [Chloroflexaceae bacterium]
MAILRFEDGTTYTQPETIARHLTPLGVQLNRWPIGDHPQIRQLLAQAAIAEADGEIVLQAVDCYFEELQAREGYQSRDLIVLHPKTPNLDQLLSKFNAPHQHDDDEVRYILDGEGIFGFVGNGGSQLELTIQPEEYIKVPAGAEHWFRLSETRRVKAVRYFTNTQGWVPHYTDTKIRLTTAAIAFELAG